MNKHTAVTLTVLFSLASVGCNHNDAGAPPNNSQAVMVRYQADPLADVQVRLHESVTGPIVAQAITAADGHARFSELPSPEPNEYFVSLESVSDGSWILDDRIVSRFTKSLRLQPFSLHSQQSIDLPPRSIKPLHPPTR